MNLKNKWVVTTDTICEGVIADKDEDGQIILYGSEDEAAREVMDCWHSMWLEGELGCGDPNMNGDMAKLSQHGTAKEILEYADEHPDLDTLDMGWEEASGFADGRKTIWTGENNNATG